MTPRPGPRATISATARTDAAGTMWRLRSLVAMGHDGARIARALGVPPHECAGSCAAGPAASRASSRQESASCGTPGGTRPRRGAPRPSGAPPPGRCARPRATTGPPRPAWTRTCSTSPATGPGAGTGPPPGRVPRRTSPRRGPAHSRQRRSHEQQRQPPARACQFRAGRPPGSGAHPASPRQASTEPASRAREPELEAEP
jgi:hypothetical protein